MGLLETLDSLDLSDDVKNAIRSEHEAEVQTSSAELAQLRAQTRRENVEREVEDLKALGLSEPGLLKFVRRVLLSDDQEPGLVLLSDNEMQLSGEQATGASNREEISVAGALRKFIELIPRSQEGRISLSDLVTDTNGDDRPGDGEPDDPAAKSAQARENLGKITGQPVTRTRKRYQGGALAGGAS